MRGQYKRLFRACAGSSSWPPNCAHTASRAQRTQLPTCLGNWARTVKERNDDGPTVPIVIAHRYPDRSGVAETWAQGILAGEQIFSGQYGNKTLAHELGHFLGGSSSIFIDGVGGVKNLMAGGHELAREQCEIAYTGAARYAVR